MVVAYLSAEVGFESRLHTYSGGLGVLAGDHIKSAADAEINLVGCTLLYRKGYARQHVDSDGIQTETFDEIDPNDFLTDTGIEIELELDGKILHSKIWEYKIKNIPTYFLDTRHPSNSAEHSALGDRLYGGDDSTRIRQEYLLGVGGVRALLALGHNISGLHLNEGHCTFAALEMLRQGWTREELAQRTLFTTHTPVPAGHDRFRWEDVEHVLGDLLPPDAKEIAKSGDSCSMSHLGIGLCGKVNAVSGLNAKVAEEMFPGNKIHPITNGVHHITWTNKSFKLLFDNKTPQWRKDPSYIESMSFSDNDLTTAKEEARSELRELVQRETGVHLDSEKLTIGFARRFATYKRANLIFSDLERLREIGAHKVQFVFSGKAHPKDMGGKKLIKSIYDGAKEIHDEIPVVFLENYSMDTGLLMTSGSDIWLNNPIRPMEASGTSGMKAALNGTPNFSILDGWWPEACVHGKNGWAIGEGEEDRDDVRDVKNILDVLEHEVLPAWENRPQWIDLMRQSIITSTGFTGARMMDDYKRFYDAFETL
tara:strand:+ start:6825 stop:8438 length:1614 start_codon:yes stop_codon:yes gene_type:complete